jgi:FK506-binding protein 1
MFTTVSRRLPRLINTTTIKPSIRSFSKTPAIMGFTKTILREGSGPSPKVNDQVTIEYTGFLKDTSKPDNKGSQYVSSSPPLPSFPSSPAPLWAEQDISNAQPRPNNG